MDHLDTGVVGITGIVGVGPLMQPAAGGRTKEALQDALRPRWWGRR